MILCHCCPGEGKSDADLERIQIHKNAYTYTNTHTNTQRRKQIILLNIWFFNLQNLIFKFMSILHAKINDFDLEIFIWKIVLMLNETQL